MMCSGEFRAGERETKEQSKSLDPLGPVSPAEVACGSPPQLVEKGICRS